MLLPGRKQFLHIVLSCPQEQQFSVTKVSLHFVQYHHSQHGHGSPQSHRSHIHSLQRAQLEPTHEEHQSPPQHTHLVVHPGQTFSSQHPHSVTHPEQQSLSQHEVRVPKARFSEQCVHSFSSELVDPPRDRDSPSSYSFSFLQA